MIYMSILNNHVNPVKDRTSQRKPNQRAAAKTLMAINEPTAVSMFFTPFVDFKLSLVPLAPLRSS